MISSYSGVTQTVAADGTLVFNTNRVLTGCTVTHVEGTPSFKLNRCGYYYITFNTDVSGATGDVTVQLLSNGTTVGGAEGTMTLAAATDTGNISFSTIIKVLPSCSVIDNLQTLTFINSGIDATFTNANVIITKLC